jgi:hypothetical protein
VIGILVNMGKDRSKRRGSLVCTRADKDPRVAPYFAHVKGEEEKSKFYQIGSGKRAASGPHVAMRCHRTVCPVRPTEPNGRLKTESPSRPRLIDGTQRKWGEGEGTADPLSLSI